jgi:hypothetical protein
MILENFVFIKQEQRRRGTCWGIDTRPSTIDIMENVRLLAAVRFFNFRTRLPWG